MAIGSDPPDLLDLLPDPILLLILNRVSDIKTLLRCRAASRRLSALVPLSDSLLLRVDRVVPPSPSLSLLQSLFHLLRPAPPRPDNSPSRILRCFPAIATLKIELPAGNLRPEKGTSIKWVARFGRTLRSCVILAGDGSAAAASGGGMKERVVWTITALIAASARHYMAAEVVSEQRRLSHLVVSDRDGEGAMIMDESGLCEFRDTIAAAGCGGCGGRTTVPAVVMRMRHEPRLELSSGAVVEGATLVVVRPSGGGVGAEEDAALAAEAFGNGVYSEHVERLLKSRSYILEMNSF